MCFERRPGAETTNWGRGGGDGEDRALGGLSLDDVEVGEDAAGKIGARREDGKLAGDVGGAGEAAEEVFEVFAAYEKGRPRALIAREASRGRLPRRAMVPSRRATSCSRARVMRRCSSRRRAAATALLLASWYATWREATWREAILVPNY